jgi:nucleotide-binding universal stress UspA family protein
MYTKILVPLDGTPLAETALRHALELSHGTGARIILVNAAQDSLAAVPEARVNVPSRQVYASAIRGMMYLQDVANRLRREGDTVQCSVLEGDPAPAILSCARRENVDVIVMGTHRRYPLSWVSRMIKGSVAGSVAAAANRPVILVKDFDTGRHEPAKPAPRELAEAA